jgi:hypothetical protein
LQLLLACGQVLEHVSQPEQVCFALAHGLTYLSPNR